MKFGPLPLEQAIGKILGHNIAGPDGKRAFRKGKPLTEADITALQAMGRHRVYVAELEPGDVNEDDAAKRITKVVMGQGVKVSNAGSGRVNLLAAAPGVVRVDPERLAQLNDYEGLTVATLVKHSAVRARQMVATIKVIPYAVPDAILKKSEAVGGPVVWVDALTSKSVGIILSGTLSARERVMHDFDVPLKSRVVALGSDVHWTDYVPLEDESGEAELAAALTQQREAGAQLIVLAGETAIMDRYDIAPRAIERAGGEVTCFGAPVDPGNLLMVGYLGNIPVLGAPGCARSRKVNVVDWVLPRLLAGDHLTRRDVMDLGHGGLLEEILERPQPREDVVKE
jgi:molybdenum cofactor cytidylyltransferase